MKMVKSLLLGSAAGVVAIAGAQAADLPVKAKPVEYVKICTLYGAGFYYIPGTDTCLKIGGFVRAEWNYNAGGSFLPNVRVVGGAPYRMDRTSDDETFRARAVATWDARTQTEFGTLRSYFNLGMTATNGSGPAGGIWFNRAFIQLAGFTAGLSVSFFDFFSFASVSNQTNVINSDTGGGGILLLAYTAQLGNGLSASLSIEDPNGRNQGIADFADIPTTWVGNSARTAGFQGFPDIVGNLRVDQAWGSAQVMGALHDVNATYYSGIVPGTTAVNPGHVQGNGYPSDEVGWAIGGGIKVNLPWLGPKDSFAVQAAYAEGALDYVVKRDFGWYDGATYGLGPTADALYCSGLAGCGGVLTGLELTKGWDIAGGITHHWDPFWQTTLYGGYAEVDYPGAVDTWQAFYQTFPGCVDCGTPSADYSFWQIGSRTKWNPVKNLDLSVDVMYSHLDTAYKGLVTGPLGASKPPGFYTLDDQDLVSFMFRAQRNFYP